MTDIRGYKGIQIVLLVISTSRFECLLIEDNYENHTNDMVQSVCSLVRGGYTNEHEGNVLCRNRKYYENAG